MRVGQHAQATTMQAVGRDAGLIRRVTEIVKPGVQSIFAAFWLVQSLVQWYSYSYSVTLVYESM